MKKRITVFATSGVLLAVTALVALCLPDSMSVAPVAAQASGPPVIELGGTLRDFPRAHADFDVVPAGGAGHYAYNIKPWLSGTGKPLFDPGGFRVDAEWTDKSGRSISPVLSGVRGGTGSARTLGARIGDTIDLDGGAAIDSFDANRGPYGVNGNYGAGAFVATNSTASDTVDLNNRATIFGDVRIGPGGQPSDVVTHESRVTGSIGVLTTATEMPDISVPTDVTADQGDVTYAATTVRLTGTIEDLSLEDQPDEPAILFTSLKLTDAAVLEVEGDLRIVTPTLTVEKDAQIRILPLGNLTIYVTSNADVVLDEAQINVSATEADTSRVTINYLGTGKVRLVDTSAMYGTVLAANGTLDIDKSDLYGSVVSRHLKLHDNSFLHLDLTSSALNGENAALTVHDKIEIKDESTIDGFDASLGPYGPGNSGPIALVQTNSTKNDRVVVDDSILDGDVMVGFGANPADVVKLGGSGVITGETGVSASLLPIPQVTAPALGPSVGDRTYSGGTHTISADLHCKHLRIESGAAVTIVGQVTIRIDDKLEMKGASEILLAPDSTLTLYVNKDAKIDEGSRINMNTGLPRLVSLRRVSVGKNGKVEIKKNSQVCAQVQGRKTELKVKEEGEFFGSFIGRKAKIENKGKVHVDMSGISACVEVADAPGTVGALDNGAISSSATFDGWFATIEGVNAALPYRIHLVENGAGVWECLEPAFHPADGLMLGNEGEAHNGNFTYSVKADFDYADCGGQFVEFRGGDGTWLFINGALVLDLGGVDSNVLQYVEVDRLGLQDGETYLFELFYAERNPANAEFHLRTNLELDSSRYMPSMNAMYD